VAAQGQRRLRVLLSAYACAPESGSEPGTAWSWVRELSRHADITVVTRANNRVPIEEWIRSHPQELDAVGWLFVDAPSWILRLKRGALGIRWYNAVWQLLALREARALVMREPHDLAHHVSLMGPGFVMVPFLPIPSVVGPFGGLQPLARGFSGIARHRLLESARKMRNVLRRVSPLWRWQLSRTDGVIVANTGTLSLLPPGPRRRCYLMQIGTEEVLDQEAAPEVHDAIIESDDPLTILWGGMHVGWKGLELFLRALPLIAMRTSTAQVVVTGTGADKAYFERLADELGLGDLVRFRGWVSREAYRHLLASCDIFVFTSLRETTGAALLEAMGQGKPTIVIDHGGPADITTPATSIKVKPESPRSAINGLADGLVRLISDRELRLQLGSAARQRIAETYSWPTVTERTVRIYASILRKSELR
jgi:glycosyltransferase involved in cell wall biosynthesis